MYSKLLEQVQKDYRSKQYSVSYADIAREVGCTRMNVYFILTGRHNNLPVLLAAARLFNERKAQLAEALAAA